MVFEKETAAKTALLLDNTELGSSQVQVTSATASGEKVNAKSTVTEDASTDQIAQEDKPRSRIFAEYLADGYVISNKAIQAALEIDAKHGISTRFTDALSQVDNKLKATERAQEIDQKYGVWSRAEAGWRGLYSYFDKAAQTPTGVRLRTFYDQGQKQVLDVHNEALHLASLKQEKNDGSTHPSEGEMIGKGTKVTAEEAQMEKVEIQGEIKTKCNCGGQDGKCPCAPGMCACSGCSKAS